MKLSWSHKLFFWLNKQINRNRVIDWAALFMAHWLIYFLAFFVLLWGVLVLSEMEPYKFILFIKLLLTSVSFAIISNWIFAFILPRRRPIVEFPKIRQLFEPYKTWKSFPSDHTTIAFIFATIPYLLGASLCFFGVALFLAFLVGSARVYAGVHYPRDILGGIFVAIFYSLISFWLLNNITQPIYLFFKNQII